jgi:transposase
MVAIPTMEEENVTRPGRERECLVNERSRITNRVKSALTRLGVRGFKPHLRKRPKICGQRKARSHRRTSSRNCGAAWLALVRIYGASG